MPVEANSKTSLPAAVVFAVAMLLIGIVLGPWGSGSDDAIWTSPARPTPISPTAPERLYDVVFSVHQRPAHKILVTLKVGSLPLEPIPVSNPEWDSMTFHAGKGTRLAVSVERPEIQGDIGCKIRIGKTVVGHSYPNTPKRTCYADYVVTGMESS
jgi:hypothetical protein